MRLRFRMISDNVIRMDITPPLHSNKSPIHSNGFKTIYKSWSILVYAGLVLVV